MDSDDIDEIINLSKKMTEEAFKKAYANLTPVNGHPTNAGSAPINFSFATVMMALFYAYIVG